jgi:hypothetical protein
MPDVQGLGDGNWILNSSEVTESNTVHGPDISYVEPIHRREVFRAGANSSNEDAVGSIHAGSHRAS